jgi:disulfide bond formation protein DsbB
MMPIIGAPARRFLLIMISIAFATTAGIGAYHAGIEYGWFIGPTTCSGNIDGNTIDELKRQLLAQPVVRCDEVTWSLLGISLAGYNFFISSALTTICGISLFVGAKDFRS